MSAFWWVYVGFTLGAIVAFWAAELMWLAEREES